MSHPIDDLADSYGAGLVFLGLVVVVLLAIQFTTTPTPGIVAILAGTLWLTADTPIDDVLSGEPETELDGERRRYVEGTIDLDEFSRRVELILDERAQRIRTTVEEVGGVGPATSAAIAGEYEDVAAVRVTSVEELTDIHGIGESTARAIVDEVGVDADEVREKLTSPASDVEAAEVSA